jgi:drug/metabolite transporter (DMT)-like permease
MTLSVFLAVLFAAFLHAAWNAVLKTGTSRIGTMFILTAFGAPLGLIVVALRPALDPAAWPWVIASACTHLAYRTFLTMAYERGDLSRVYPIARGGGPMLVAVVGAVVLEDVVSALEYAGIVILGLGIALMAQGVFREGENRRLLPYALGSATATAIYTLIDGMGARVAGDAVTYIAWVFVVDGLLFPTVIVLWRGRGIIPQNPRDWAIGSVASVASYAAYAISVWAMTVAPIALVAALRETSILFAVLIGWLLFRERMTRAKAVAVAVIVGGVMLTRL